MPAHSTYPSTQIQHLHQTPTTPALPYTTIGLDVTIACPPPRPSFDPNLSRCHHNINGQCRLTSTEIRKKKIGRENKTDKITGTTTTGDTVIGDLLDRNMILIPIAIDPFGRFGPILQTFLYDTQPTNPITFTFTKPNAITMYHKITHFPSPKGILKLTDHNWKLTQTRRFY
jgi:hypothetical protein